MGTYRAVAVEDNTYAIGESRYGSKALTARIDTLYNHEYDRSVRKEVVGRTETTECKRMLALDDQACKDALSELVLKGTPAFWAQTLANFSGIGVVLLIVFCVVIGVAGVAVSAQSLGQAVLTVLKSWIIMLFLTAISNVSLMWRCAGRFWRDRPAREAVTAVMLLLPFLFGMLLDKWNAKAGMDALWVLPPSFFWSAWVMAFESVLDITIDK